MNIEMLKDKLSSYAQKYNLTFAKKISKRKEFLFSLGESKFLPKEVDYIISSETSIDECINLARQTLL